MNRFIKYPGCLIIIVFSSLVCAGETNIDPDQKLTTHFSTTGDIEVSVDEANAQMVKIAHRIPAINITSSVAAIKKLGRSYNVNLFFSNTFDLKVGVYPVEFSYRTEKDTFGGSFTTRGERFSHDTKGVAEVLEVGDTVKVRFKFETFNASQGKEGRKGVMVTGEAVAAYEDIFK